MADYRGVPVLAAYRTIPRTAWGFVATVDAAEAFAPVAALLKGIALVTALVLLSGAAAGACLAGTLTHPLVQLVAAARSVAAGHYEAAFQVRRHDEFALAGQTRSWREPMTRPLKDGPALSTFETRRRKGAPSGSLS